MSLLDHLTNARNPSGYFYHWWHLQERTEEIQDHYARLHGIVGRVVCEIEQYLQIKEDEPYLLDYSFIGTPPVSDIILRARRYGSKERICSLYRYTPGLDDYIPERQRR